MKLPTINNTREALVLATKLGYNIEHGRKHHIVVHPRTGQRIAVIPRGRKGIGGGHGPKNLAKSLLRSAP